MIVRQQQTPINVLFCVIFLGGNEDSSLPVLDICFGGRRKFCGGSYVDFGEYCLHEALIPDVALLCTARNEPLLPPNDQRL